MPAVREQEVSARPVDATRPRVRHERGGGAHHAPYLQPPDWAPLLLS